MRIYVDKITGTWGDAEGLVILDVESTEALEDAADSTIIAFAQGPCGVVGMPYQNRTRSYKENAG